MRLHLPTLGTIHSSNLPCSHFFRTSSPRFFTERRTLGVLLSHERHSAVVGRNPSPVPSSGDEKPCHPDSTDAHAALEARSSCHLASQPRIVRRCDVDV